ncbi:hypothetical protein K2V52_03255 [Staphylococcus nepalensis]|uniref:hypothetical protein n=1 Tax=Staphylococcus nepalensis TaxID=214473 RepID=UPI001E616CEC|nr:hypothetical protein [Staphylococcus nepalensis]MCD8890979.1 hypothetical protein [Staphylococcus nepalensis]
MVKIKREVKKNLPQLIEWAWDNKIRNKQYRSSKGAEIQFDEGDVVRVYRTDSDDLFTVEVDEEITEETVIPKMLVIGRFDGYEEVYNRKLSSFTQHLLSAYLIHDDGCMELIYDESKGLVE